MATVDRLVPSAQEPWTLSPGLTCGPGALPHLDLAAAATFGAEASTIPTLPTLPRLSPSQSEMHQALGGIAGVLPGPYGTFSIDVHALDPEAPSPTDFDGSSFGGFIATLDRLVERNAVNRDAGSRDAVHTVKWQMTGPIMIAEAIYRAGADVDLALAVGRSTAQRRMVDISAQIARRLPDAHQVIVIDELDLATWASQRGVAPGECLDAVSSALAAGAGRGTVGITGPRGASLTSMIETGPQMVGVRHSGLQQSAGQLARFVEAGGGLLWQIGRASGPITEPRRRTMGRLSGAVNMLAAAGADLDQVAARSVVTTDGGFAGHDVTSAWLVMSALERLAVYFVSGSALRGVGASDSVDSP